MPLVVPLLYIPNQAYLASKFYNTWFGRESGSSAIPAIDVIYLYPFPLYAPMLVKTMVMRSITGGAGSSVKSGIWANSPVSNRPLGAPLVVDNTGQATTSSGVAITVTVSPNVTLGPGWYWFGSKTTGTQPAMTSQDGTVVTYPFFVGCSANTSVVNNAISFADTYSNSMPTLAEGASFTELSANGVPICALGT